MSSSNSTTEDAYEFSQLSDSELWRYYKADDVDYDFMAGYPTLVRWWDPDFVVWVRMSEARESLHAFHIRNEVMRALRGEGRVYSKLFTQCVMAGVRTGAFEDIAVPVGMRAFKAIVTAKYRAAIERDKAEDTAVEALNAAFEASRRTSEAEVVRARAKEDIAFARYKLGMVPKLEYGPWELPSVATLPVRRRLRVIIEDDDALSHIERAQLRRQKRNTCTRGRSRLARRAALSIMAGMARLRAAVGRKARLAAATASVAVGVQRRAKAFALGASWMVRHYGGKFTAAMQAATRWTREVVPQSGRAAPSARSQRDEQQRAARKKRDEAARKAVPKAQREKQIKADRDKRSGVIEPQSGMALKLAGCFAGGLLASKLMSLFSKADALLESAGAVAKFFKKAKKLLMSQLGSTLWVVPLVLLSFKLLDGGELRTKLGHAALVAGLTKIVGPSLWQHISDFFRSGDVKPQAGALDVVPKLLATVMTFSVLRGKMSATLVSDLMRRLSLMDRCAGGVSSFMSWCAQAIEACVNATRALFGKERIDLFRSADKPMREWAREVDRIAVSISVCESDPAPELLNRLVALIRDGATYRDLYRGTAPGKYVEEYMIKLNGLLMPYAGALNARNNFRFEPDACLLVGEPGIGKTVLAMPLCMSILAGAGLVPGAKTFEDLSAEVWQKGTSEFWNSYAGQACVVMDDAFQARTDASDKENEYMTIIRMCSTWSYPLNFADLTSKGKIFFMSKFIYGTTNLESIRSSAGLCVHEPSAVVRRINHPYRLVLKDEYKSGGYLDQSKYQEEIAKCSANKGLDHFPWYMWTVRKHDFFTGITSNVDMPLRDLVEQIIASLKRKVETFGATRDYLSNFVGALLQGESDVVPQAGTAKFVFGAFSRGLERICRVHEQEMQDDARRFRQFEKVTLFGKVLLGTIGLSLAIVTAFKVLRALFEGFCALFKSSGKQKEHGAPRVQSNRPLSKPQRLKVNDIRLQAGDHNVVNNVYANSYKLWFADVHGIITVVGQVIFLTDRLAVLPEHYYSMVLESKLLDGSITPDTELNFVNAVTSSHSFKLKVSTFLQQQVAKDVNNDVAFCVFKSARAHRNVVSAFLNERDLQYLGGTSGRVDICEVTDGVRVKSEHARRVYVVPSVSVGKALVYGSRRLERYVSYKALTTNGDCGAPVSLIDNSSYSGRSVYGIHVAGSELWNLGYCAIVTQEMIHAAITKFQVVVDDFMRDLSSRGVSAQACYELPSTHGGSFLPICLLDKAVESPTVTKYFVTERYGIFGEYECLPAPLGPVLRNGEICYPMANAVAPYATDVLFEEPSELVQAVHVAMSRFTALTVDYSRRLYTFEEAICGVSQEKFRSIPRGTSAGFPYVYDVRDGKKSFFGDGDTYDLNTASAKELRQRVEFVEKQAKKGVRCSHIFVDFLKDELRTKKKVEAAATRLISSAPLDYTVLWRMYFGAFSSAMMRNHTHSGMAPGICCFSDWQELCRLLTTHGSAVFAGDFKAFDSSEQEPLLMRLLDYINAWYNDGEDNQRVRHVLWLDLVHSRHVGGSSGPKKYVYQWNKSLPSGHPFTTICNSMYSLTALVACYIRLTGDRANFWTRVFTITYGDDNVNNVSKQVVDVFNQVTVAFAMKEMFGMVYTSDKKDDELTEFTTLSDVSFLKRRFYLSPAGCLCPLELDSFLYSVYWCKNKRLKEQIAIDELENSLQELSLHEPHVWNEWAPKVYSHLVRVKPVPQCPCAQNEYLRLVQSRTDAWY